MATIPDLAAVKTYLGTDHSWSDSEIEDTLNAQVGDQAKKCTVPTDAEDPTWMPDALAQALLRRTHVALSLKALPLAVQVTLSDVNAAQVRVGSPSKDPLVYDLERPYRKLVLG
ncbi:hypothetical protein G5C66_07850 [Nocardioides sp. KC13]|uniref:Uncharacterized protein n=1 Tax=Nocardioides turkmenicus TaxID=2711220 RepID=A0A6M1R4M7_9ACTN|nr:hypothetical protein [Nocardioides sp. KC13]NGN92649.1 hypothetical protein [Nocardioides sp. KC13]